MCGQEPLRVADVNDLTYAKLTGPPPECVIDDYRELLLAVDPTAPVNVHGASPGRESGFLARAMTMPELLALAKRLPADVRGWPISFSTVDSPTYSRAELLATESAPQQEVILRVTKDGLQPITRAQIQDGDHVVRCYIDRLYEDAVLMPEKVAVQQLLGTKRGADPETHFGSELRATALWLGPRNRTADPWQEKAQVLRVPFGVKKRGFTLHDLPDRDPDYAVRVQIIEQMKAFVKRNDNREPTHLDMTAEMERRLRNHCIVQRMDIMGTHANPLRPETLLGLQVTYDAEQGGVS